MRNHFPHLALIQGSMADYFGASATAMEEPLKVTLPAWDPEAPLGSAENPVGPFPPPAPGTYLLGVKCTCGKAFLVYATHFDSEDPLCCPQCEGDLKTPS